MVTGPAGAANETIAKAVTSAVEPSDGRGCGGNVDDEQPTTESEARTRLEALGARRAVVGQGPDVTWIVPADPDGNEFSVLRDFRPEELADQAGG